MQGCIYTLRREFTVKCQVNPEVGKELKMALVHADKPKRVLVIGGGPAGMEAAKVAALRGHHVTLYEKAAELGGQFRLASVPPGKQEILPYLKYQARQLEKNKVNVVLGREADASTVAELKPDVVIVATGGKPKIPDIPGIRGQNLVTAQEVLSFKAVTGKRVLVAGGGMVGCETAHLLASYGRDVTIVEMLPELASDMSFGPRYYLLRGLEEHKVKVITSACIENITPQGVTCSRDGLAQTIGKVDTIVLAMGALPATELAKQLESKVGQVHVIGDAQNPANAMEAVAAGAQIGRAI
jgi:NADPH-dependent 2,4-dienoyl-CoA reductase/sulfur reductase-like enzyme